jgi:SAM-dependent methyltransferase
MDRQYWDSKAKNYDKEIFFSILEDKTGLFKRQINKFASKKHDAADLGCGTGSYLPFLSKKFKSVYACDLSPKLIKKAEKNCFACGNITFETVDMAKQKFKLSGIRFAVSANVLIIPDDRIRRAIIRNIYRALPRGARLMLVVPSLESVLYVNYRLFEWNIKDGMIRSKAIEAGLKSEHRKSGSVADGLINIDGVTHKHYLKEELVVFLKSAGFKPEIVEKIEYRWDTEFDRPPAWMKKPYPWDWMVICRK